MRYITPYILEDLKKKMVFLGGPRQVGKTTLSKHILEEYFPKKGRYFNWDFDEDRKNILEKKWSINNNLLIFDEIHKHPRWKSWIKGIYDVSNDSHSFLVTGSARLDIYQKGGDSLIGRYHYWRLHPFTLDDVPENIDKNDAFSRLMRLGGFPEPFLENDEKNARRWKRNRLNLVIREDIRDLEQIRNIQLLTLFLDELRKRAGSLITISNIARDIEITPKTAKSWLELLSRMYISFTVLPYTRSLPRAVLKPAKAYFFDNSDVIGDDGARFENLVATSLLKRVHFWEDRDGYNCKLHYIRDKEGREVDFAIIKENEIEELIEVKLSDSGISRSLRYYKKRLKPKKTTQIVANLKNPYEKDGISVTNPIFYFKDFF
jgi:uncharacterized protein